MPKKVITDELTKYVKDNYLSMSGTQIAENFGVSKSVVYRIMRINGLEVPKSVWHKWKAEKLKGRSIMTPEQDEMLKKHLLDIPVKPLAKKIGVSQTVLRTRIRQLQLKIPREIIEQRKLDSQLKKGSIPPNKGKKMDAATREKVKHTWFQKGHLPANTLSDGDITIRHEHSDRNGGKPYKYIRISKGEWVQLHRHLWEEANGPIPEGMNIVFKDGDTLNCELNNLEMIDNAENMRRNSIHNYPEELKTNIRLTKKLERKIRDHEQHNGTK